MFTNCKTLEELKKNYHLLALKNHPDKGGSTELMQKINSAYDTFFEKLKNYHANKDGEIYTKETTEAPNHFKDIINNLMNMEGITAEIIGSFVWVSGDTKPHKDAIKAMGFKWHTKKLCWYLPPIDYRKFNKKTYSLDEIRDMFGSSGKYEAEKKLKLA